jgi:hypothetical protein
MRAKQKMNGPHASILPPNPFAKPTIQILCSLKVRRKPFRGGEMKTGKAISITFAIVLALGVVAPAIWASERDQATQLTFTQPVQIPGNIVLQPGTYWFTIAVSPSNRNLVQIFDINWQPITTTIAASTEHSWRSDNTQLTFAERSADQPDVLLKWYYPGETIGHEFIYSGRGGRALSEETVNVETVLAEPAPVATAYRGTNGRY